MTDQLNPAQLEAVRHTNGPLLIFAGAGSGKTRVLTYRIAHLMEQGIDPYHILAITFTNKAAKEMRERVTDLTPNGDQVWVSTFHAACTRILRREAHVLGFAKGFSIYDAADSLRLIKDCIKELKLDDMYYRPASVQNTISAQKNELITPERYEKHSAGQYRDSIIADIYSLYQKRLSDMHALDFDDIIMKTVELLQQNEEVLLRYQNRFRYVMVDEYQDTNHAQYVLVSLLAGYANNLCVVGDDDQGIYSWRGANIRNILQFEADYAGTKVIKLEENYRSTQTILDAANDVITNNENRAQKKLWTQNTKGHPVRVYMANRERDESDFVARTIKQEVQAKNANYNDFAVLYRANAQSRVIEDSFAREGIPYRMYGGVRFYERMEVKDILAYLKAINNPADDIALLRIINLPKRGIGQATISKVQEYAVQNNLTLGQALLSASKAPGVGKKATSVENFAGMMLEISHYAESNSVVSVLKKILKDTDYFTHLNDGTPEGEERVSSIMELVATATTFEKESDDTSLGKFLEDVALVADVDNYQESANAVTLMTLHSAKGLEFNVVFMVGMEENIFPSYRSIEDGGAAQMEEERRLCYVGITRAKKILYLSHAMSRMQYNNVVYNAPSRFLSEVDIRRMTPVNSFGKPKEVVKSAATRSSTGNSGLNSESPKPKSTFGIRTLPQPKSTNYTVGDKVRMAKYGRGEVTEIRKKEDGYEVIINFETEGHKGFKLKSLKKEG